MTTTVDSQALDEGDSLEVLLIDGSGQIIALSSGAARYLGHPAHELKGRGLGEVFREGIHPAFPWLDGLINAGSPPPPLLLNLEHPQSEMASIPIEAVLYAIEVGAREKGETVAGLAIRPSTGSVVESELLAAQRSILELVGQRSSVANIMLAIANFAEKMLPSEVFCLLTPLSETGAPEVGQGPTLPKDLQHVLGTHFTSGDGSPGLNCIQNGKMLVASDLDQEASWGKYGRVVRSHGLVSVWSFPIFDSRANSVRAVLEFYLPIRRVPNRLELRVIDELSQLVRLAIDLHQLQSDLDSSESTLLSTVQAIPMLLWEADGEGRFTDCQGKGLELIGMRSGEVVGKFVWDIFSSHSNAKAVVMKALAGENVASEFSVGMTQFIQSSGPLRNQAGAIMGARGVALDVTAQRLAEEVAHKKDALLKTVIDTALDAVVTIDLQGKIILWNKQAELLFGWTKDEILGKQLEDTIIPPSMVKAHKEGMRRYHTHGTGPILGRRIEISAINRKGVIFPVELAVSPHHGKYEGGFSAFIRDISDRRRSEHAVKTSEERLNLVIEASSDGFWDYRLDGGPSVVSDRCLTMLGYKVGDAPITTPDVNPLVHPDDAALVKKTWDTHLAGKSPRYESQHRRRASDGSWRWILDRGKVVERIEGDKPTRVSGTQTDITERRGLEASLSAAERMESLGLLASGFAQELDSVLSVIRAHASLANIATGLPRKAVESLEVIQLAVARAKAMGRNLIQLGQASEIREPARPVVVSDSVREAVRLLSPNLPRTVTVQVEDLTDGRERVAIDSSHLQQAILNLLMRSTEALANQGVITIRLTQAISSDESLVRIECIDQGEPLNELEQRHAFDALAADGSLRGRNAMGLAAVERFAHSAGGAVSVACTSAGTNFCISLPAVSERSIQEKPPIVLVENHPLLRPMLVEALQASGHRVSAIEDSAQLLGAAKRMGSRCILILDQDSLSKPLPDLLSGIQSGLKAMPQVILLSNDLNKPIDTDLPLNRLQKPFMLEALLAEIDKGSAPER